MDSWATASKQPQYIVMSVLSEVHRGVISPLGLRRALWRFFWKRRRENVCIIIGQALQPHEGPYNAEEKSPNSQGQ